MSKRGTKHFGEKIVDVDVEDFALEDFGRRFGKAIVGHTRDRVSLAIDLSPTPVPPESRLEWVEIALANLEPKAARALAHALLLGADLVEFWHRSPATRRGDPIF